MLLQIIVTIFALFAVSRSFLKLKKGTGTLLEFVIWLVLWSLVVLIVFIPRITSYPADLLGISRGIDVFVYLGLLGLFYSVYRIYAKIDAVEQEITALTREIALGKKK